MYNSRKMKSVTFITRVFVIAVATMLISGCSSGSIKYRNYQADTSYVVKVAVLPFNNLGGDKFAPERVRTMFIVDMMSRNRWDIVEQGEVTKVLGQILRASGAVEGGVIELNNESLKLLGERLGVQAVVVGSVNEYVGRGTNEISIATKMMDTASGVVLWQAVTSIPANTPIRAFFGMEPPIRSVLTKKVVRKAVNSMPK